MMSICLMIVACVAFIALQELNKSSEKKKML